MIFDVMIFGVFECCVYLVGCKLVVLCKQSCLVSMCAITSSPHISSDVFLKRTNQRQAPSITQGTRRITFLIKASVS